MNNAMIADITDSLDLDGAAPDWCRVFADAIAEGENLAAMDIPPRPSLLGEWFKEADLGMIFAARGVGKTRLSIPMAHALAEGKPLGEWRAGDLGQVKVLYVDGEMNLPDSVERERQAETLGFRSDSVTFLHHEQLREGRSLNLADPEQQEALLLSAKRIEAKVVFLDNLSCLFRGVDENDNDAWEKVVPWLMRFRRAGIAVVIVHHAGRNGEARGASRREDAAHWVLKLESDGGGGDKTSLTSYFTKCRNCTQGKAPSLRWEIADNELRCEAGDFAEDVIDAVRSGYTTSSEIAELVSCSASRVSKTAKRLIDSGRLKKNGRSYALP